MGSRSGFSLVLIQGHIGQGREATGRGPRGPYQVDPWTEPDALFPVRRLEGPLTWQLELCAARKYDRSLRCARVIIDEARGYDKRDVLERLQQGIGDLKSRLQQHGEGLPPQYSKPGSARSGAGSSLSEILRERPHLDVVPRLLLTTRRCRSRCSWVRSTWSLRISPSSGSPFISDSFSNVETFFQFGRVESCICPPNSLLKIGRTDASRTGGLIEWQLGTLWTDLRPSFGRFPARASSRTSLRQPGKAGATAMGRDRA